MEDLKKKNDGKPYIVFSCTNCNQFIYSKLTQKTKKCIRCGKVHSINSIKKNGEIVNGITNAFEYTKKKQNELAIKLHGSHLTFQTQNDFFIGEHKQDSKKISTLHKRTDLNEDYSDQFSFLLQKLSKTYKEFPIYLIELMIEDYKIPISELKVLINKFKIKGILVPLPNHNFKVNL